MNTSGLAATTVSTAPSLRRKSGVSTSIVVAGSARGWRGSAREMRCAAVGEIVAIDRGDDHMGEAELGGRVGDAGRLGRIERPGSPVRTLQKAQARVQVSPMIMKVACFLSQHSPILGQPASSQTVCRPFARTIAAVSDSPATPAP